MQKIILKALELAGYKDANTLAEIVAYVPNPQVATEMLLGIHVPKTIEANTEFRKHRYNSHKEIVEITGYNELADTVNYIIYNPKQQQAYYATEEDKRLGLHTFIKPSDYYDWNYVNVPGVTKTETSCKISDFEENFITKISLDETMQILSQWEGVTSVEEISVL